MTLVAIAFVDRIGRRSCCI
ncbi:hypothetical protein [Arthrobacter citreus]